jgi:hypothetical protein
VHVPAKRTRLGAYVSRFASELCTPHQRLVVPGRIYHITRVEPPARKDSPARSDQDAAAAVDGSDVDPFAYLRKGQPRPLVPAPHGYTLQVSFPGTFAGVRVSRTLWDDNDRVEYIGTVAATTAFAR